MKCRCVHGAPWFADCPQCLASLAIHEPWHWASGWFWKRITLNEWAARVRYDRTVAVLRQKLDEAWAEMERDLAWRAAREKYLGGITE